MRPVHWIYVLSIVFFVASVGLFVAGTRATQRQPQRQPDLVTPVASMKQVMNGMVAPASAAVLGAVSTTITTHGVEEKAPKSDEEWEAVANSAAMLVEAGNLMMIGNRVRDTGDWIKMSRALMDAGQISLKAAQARNVAALFESGEAVDVSCDTCHQKYQ